MAVIDYNLLNFAKGEVNRYQIKLKEAQTQNDEYLITVYSAKTEAAAVFLRFSRRGGPAHVD